MHVKFVVICVSVVSVAQAIVHPRANPSAAEVTEATKETIDNSTISTNKPSSPDYSHLTEEFLSCLKMMIEPDQYVIQDNGTLYAHAYAKSSWKVSFDYGNYFIFEDKKAAICHSSLSKKKSELPDNYRGLPYVTVIGMSASLLCLILHFIGFLTVPEMRNLPGKNVASLTVAIFFAYLFFLVGNLGFEETPLCHPLGVCIYYFMMASFFWMNAISFDVFKTVRGSTKFRKKTKSAERKWFVVNSLYSWMAPAVLTAIVVAGDLLTFLPDDFRPKFDEQRCWFGRRLSLIVFFAVPLAILMLANTAFFVMSGVMVCKNSLKSQGRTKRLKKTVMLHLKLAIIVGLVWITGLIAGIVDNVYVWYIFVSLTVLQGVYIFFAFTRFKKTGERLRQRMNSMVTTIHTSSFFSSSTNLNSTKSGISAVV